MSTPRVRSSPFVLLITAAGLATLLGLLASLMGGNSGPTSSAPASGPATAQAQPAKASTWAAIAPGRIEPRGGEVRLSAQFAGRITEIPVALNDLVQSGDLLVRIDDDEARARLVAADAEAAVRRRERDAEAAVGRPALDRRQAEDLVAASERAVLVAQTELDRALRLRRSGTATDEDVQRDRRALVAAIEKRDADRSTLRRTQTAAGVPLPTRLEAGLTASRADVALAEHALERTRLRAPIDGTVLQINPRVGETVAPSPEHVVIVVGDVSRLRVRAEVEERDVSRVRVGQQVVIRSDAFAGREFSGVVTTRAQALSPGRLAPRGPRRPTDVDTLEVTIDVEEGAPLLPGMRVDVFFRADTTQTATPSPAVAPAPPIAPAQPVSPAPPKAN